MNLDYEHRRHWTPMAEPTETPDFLRLRAFFEWCFIFGVLAVLALWEGVKAVLAALHLFGKRRSSSRR